MSKTLKCPCGACSCELGNTTSVGARAEETGFGFVWDVSRGLDPLWLCPTCDEIVQEAWAKIVETTKVESIQIPRRRKS